MNNTCSASEQRAKRHAGVRDVADPLNARKQDIIKIEDVENAPDKTLFIDSDLIIIGRQN